MSAAPPDALPSARRGQPLRFIAMVLMLWAGVRIATAVPSYSSPLRFYEARADGPGADLIAIPAPPEPAAAQIRAAMRKEARYYGQIARAKPVEPAERLRNIPIVRAAPVDTGQGALPLLAERSRYASSSMVAEAPPVELAQAGRRSALPPVPVTRPAPATDSAQRRWSGSAWLFWRQKVARSALGSAGQLGGARAGIRINRALGAVKQSVPISAYARLSSALYQPTMPEAAVGVAATPISGRMPLSIGVERRIALSDDARNAFALIAAGGLNSTNVTDFLVADGYWQAGMVGLSRRDLFVDGRLSIAAILDRNGRTKAGFSVSGGAQPGLSRLDIGPAIETRLPIGGLHPRLIIEWRHRVAGRSKPDSGLAVTLATDF
ncbi:MAG: hypothetical protein R3E04_11440 [Sphingobium sp.]